ncbi:hypothetical protein GYMLUDRAFT_56952 [Collybiopsis luxurians FD-317 M1]|nr:hypothetical protein GYMLUDRAFT_56952 [Collybiopsis luxurians FD-317 M1]
MEVDIPGYNITQLPTHAAGPLANQSPTPISPSVPQSTSRKCLRSPTPGPVEEKPEPMVCDKVQIVESDGATSLLKIQLSKARQAEKESKKDSAVAWGMKEQSLLETVKQLNQSLANPQTSAKVAKDTEERSKELQAKLNLLEVSKAMQKCTEVAGLEEQKSKLWSERDKYKRNVNQLNALVREQKSEMETLDAIQNEQENMQKEIDRLKEELKQKTAELASLQAKAEDSQSALELQQKISALEHLLSEEQLSNQQLQAAEAEIQEVLEARDIHINELQELEANDKATEFNQLRDELEKMEREQDLLGMKLQEITQEKDQRILNLEQSSTEQAAELVTAKETIDKNSKLITALKSQHSAANATAAMEKKACESLQDQLMAEQSQLKKALKDLEDHCCESDNELAKQELARQAAQNEIWDLKRDPQAEVERCADYDKLQADVQIAQSNETSMKVHMTQLESDKKELQEHFGGDWVSKARFVQLQANCEDLEKKVEQLNNDLYLSGKDLTTAREEIQQKDEHVSHLESSSKAASKCEEVLKKEKDLVEKQNNILINQVAVLTQAGPSASMSAVTLLQSEVELLKTSLNSSKASVDTLKTSPETSQASEKKLREANNILSAKVNSLKASIESSKAFKSNPAKEDNTMKKDLSDHSSYQQENFLPSNSGQNSSETASPSVRTIRSTRRYLNHADVPSGVSHAKESMRRKYGLGEELSSEDDSSTEEASIPKATASGRTGSGFQRDWSFRRAYNTKAKGKQRQRDEDPSSGIEEFFSDNDVESNTGCARDAYLHLGTHSKQYWTAGRQKNSRNKMIRDVLGEMLHIKVMEDAPD